ncbi:MAG: serine/threonine protein phosphatase, partial [Thomasclavelia ramosa]
MNVVKLWIANGGDKTINSINDYLEKDTMKYEDYCIIRREFLKRVYEYLKSLPNYLEISVNEQNYVLVHAGIDVRKPLNQQVENDLLWIREKFYLQRGDLTKIYIFGHTPTVLLNDDFSFDIWFDTINHNKIGIDGGLACGTVGQLNCLCLNDGKITVIEKNSI